MSDEPSGAAYHDAHLDDPAEWETAEEVATVQPSGSTIFSLRIPNQELDALREAARERSTSVSELLRAAARAYMHPPVTWVEFGQAKSPENQPATAVSQASQFTLVTRRRSMPEPPRARILV